MDMRLVDRPSIFLDKKVTGIDQREPVLATISWRDTDELARI